MTPTTPFSPPAPAIDAQTRRAQDFERMVMPHRDAAQSLARGIMRHEQDAEDCVQEAYFRAYRAFGQFRGQDAKGWLLVIVRNTCYLQLRRRKRGGFPIEFNEVIHSEAESLQPATRSDTDALAQGLLPQALERLPAEARSILVLREIDGLAYKEIRSLMSIPMGTVMSRLSRARLRLQAEVLELVKKTSAFDCTGAVSNLRRQVRAA